MDKFNFFDILSTASVCLVTGGIGAVLGYFKKHGADHKRQDRRFHMMAMTILTNDEELRQRLRDEFWRESY